MESLKKIVANRKKSIGKSRIGINGEEREPATFRIRPSVMKRFESEFYKRKSEGEKITKADAIEEAIELWIESKNQ